MNKHIDISKMSREEKLDLLSKDFLDRDGDHFVRIRRSGRLGWEKTLAEDSAYSSVILSPHSDEDLLKNAYRLASQMIVAMDTPFKVTVRIDATRSCTDSRSVFVASRVLDDASLSVGRRLDVFLGLAIHEGSHLLYTDFTGVRQADNALVHHIHNVLEDERIERELGERKPGLANFLKAVKQYHFGRYEEKMRDKEDEVRLSDFARLYNAVFSIVRYPASLDMDDAAHYADTLIEIRDLLVPFPETTAACLEKAKEIYEIMKRRLQEEQDQNQPDDASGDSSQEEGESCDGNEEKPGEPEGKRPEEGSRTPSGQNPGGKEPEGEAQGESAGYGTDQPGQAGEALTDETLEALYNGIEDALSELSGEPSAPGDNPLTAGDMAEAARRDGALLAKECEGVLERGATQGTVVISPEENGPSYGESLGRVRRYIPAIAQALRSNSTDYAYNLTGMRSGLLDTNKLGEARQGVQTVYVRKGRVTSDRVAVALVIDESGSMDGIRERLARDTAVLVNEAVGKIPNVDLYIYGYTSTCSRNIVRNYREGVQAGRGFRLGSIGSFGGTPTAAAILEAASRIRRRTAERTLMFIISDGCAEGGARAVRTASDQVRRDGFTPVGISIASSLPAEELRQMYDSYIVMGDIAALATSLGKIVKKAVLKTAGRKTR